MLMQLQQYAYDLILYEDTEQFLFSKNLFVLNVQIHTKQIVSYPRFAKSF